MDFARNQDNSKLSNHHSLHVPDKPQQNLENLTS